MNDKLYAVSFISFFDNKLETKFIRAANEVEATLWMLKIKHLDPEEFPRGDDWTEVENLKQLAFDCDSMVHAEEVPVL